MLVKRNPELSNIFDELLKDLSISTNENSKMSTPAVNIKETEKEFVVSLAVPGMNKKDFNINIDNELLTISSETKEETKDNNDNYTRKEYSFNSFKRSFNIPKDAIESEKISAKYKNGELIINIPKKEIIENKPKMIDIK
ncbi:MAG: Hsp20/alpha crystallin family protein [Bacteroidota bacterium]